MKKAMLIFFALFYAGFQAVYSQALTVNDYRGLVRQSYLNSNLDVLNAKGKIVNLEAVNGSPYWSNKFEKGKIILNDGTNTRSVDTYLRYRIFDDVFEIRKSLSSTKIMGMQRSPNITVILGNKKFVFLQNLPVEIRGTRSGYAMVLIPATNGGVALYKRMSQNFIPAVPPKNSYDKGKKARLEENDYYFVKINGELYRIHADKRAAYKDFPDHQKELKQFMKKNRIKFRHKEVDADMVRLVNYYKEL